MTNWKNRSAPAALVGLIAGSILATTNAAASAIEEIEVIGEQDRRVYELSDTLDLIQDSAALLRGAVGANVVRNGPLTGIAQYRGMSRFRVSTTVDGSVISAGGPNWMDPPLSYAPAVLLESLEVHRGIAPVSAGQETIGGAMSAQSWQGEYATGAPEFSGRARTGYQSINDSTVIGGAAVLASRQQRLKLSGLLEQGNDAEFSDGTILPTEFDRSRGGISYGYRTGPHEFTLAYDRSETGDTGTPALAMDIEYIDSDLGNLTYTYSGDTRVEAKLYYSDIAHGMSNYHLRQAPPSRLLWRRNFATGENLGFRLLVERNGWRVGMDNHREVHNSIISNPNAASFFVDNFNDADRTVVGVFAEHTRLLTAQWQLEFGLRYNQARTDADSVDATPAVMGMPPAIALRDRFNGADRSQTDHNLDWMSRLRYEPLPGLQLHGAIARKSRAPAYQERYLWLPLQATAGLADGRSYTGNLTLDSEVAHELELGLDWSRDRFHLSPRVFFREVSDYIQGTPSTNSAAVMFVTMMNGANGTATPAPLEFSNVDARFYGADLDWQVRISPRWRLSGVVNYVRGERRDVNDDLYRIAPLNGLLAIDYQRSTWGVRAESFLSARQGRVSATNGETPTDGYAVLGIKGYWDVAKDIRLGLGIDNLTDAEATDHLAGINRVRGNPDIEPGTRLPGYGRAFFLRLDYDW